MSAYLPQDETNQSPGKRHEYLTIGAGIVRKPIHLPHRLGPERKKRIRIEDIIERVRSNGGTVTHPNLLGRIVNFFKRLINRLLS